MRSSFHPHKLFNSPAHKKLVSLGPQGTAAKIIINIVEDWIKKNNLQLDNTLDIEDMSLIINKFASAIENIINYPLYKKQSKEVKNEIKEILSNDLGEIVRINGSFQQIGKSATLKNKKVQHAFAKNKSYNEFISVVKEKHKTIIKFPDKPFYNEKELENHIITSLEKKYVFVIKNHNLEDDNKRRSINSLFTKKLLPGHKLLAEQILSEIIKRWVSKNPHEKNDIKTKDWDFLIETLHAACLKTFDYQFYQKQSEKCKNELFEILVTHLMNVAQTANVTLTKTGSLKQIQQIGIQYVDGNEYQDEHFFSLQMNQPTSIKLPDKPFYSETDLRKEIAVVLYPKYKTLLEPKLVDTLSNINKDPMIIQPFGSYQVIDDYDSNSVSVRLKN